MDTSTTDALLVVDTAPVATVVGDNNAPAVPRATSSAQSVLSCGDAIDPLLYAVDMVVALIDLRQETKCEIAPPPAPGEPRGTDIHDPTVLRWLKALSAIAGWILTSLAILTFSGVLQRQKE